LIWQERLPVEVLAAAMALLAAPLIADLLVSLAGNLRRPRARHAASPRAIRLAVVVPAHNEETMLAGTVRSLLASGCVAAEAPLINEWRPRIFVVAHNCTDATSAVAAQAGARVIKLGDPGIRGKGAALRAGFRAALAAGANAFLVVDADSTVSGNIIAATSAALASGAAATQCRYELQPAQPGPVGALARLRMLAFRGMNVLRARGRAGLGFSAGVFGNGFALTAETLDRVPYAMDSICEDLEYHVWLVLAGLRVAWVEEACVHAPLAPARAAQSQQEARWEGGRFHVAVHATSRLLRAVFAGHWRALEVLAEVWSLPLSRGVLALGLMALMPVFWLHVVAVTGAAVVAVYVIEAALLGDQPWRDLAALAGAPVHILRKLVITPLVLRQSRRGAEWARTRREARSQ
jgi:cellulose synthase/poly-beta-1,6-N-acetylglucosamine synthase-like glycosyltransferase